MTITKPDLSYVVGLVSKFMQAPRKQHLNAARCILQYANSMLHFILFYEARRPIAIYAYMMLTRLVVSWIGYLL